MHNLTAFTYSFKYSFHNNVIVFVILLLSSCLWNLDVRCICMYKKSTRRLEQSIKSYPPAINAVFCLTFVCFLYLFPTLRLDEMSGVLPNTWNCI